jgi:hypothetical protein
MKPLIMMNYKLIDGIQYKIFMQSISFCGRFWYACQFYFNQLPLDGTKESFYHKEAPELDLDVIVNTVFYFTIRK